MIPESVIDEIQDRSDIVEVISQAIPLKRAGRSFKARCPFHMEKTPSFIVSSDKQIFHCFGCGVGGNVFSFLMKYEKLEFPEAVKRLADRAGIAIPEDADPTAQAVERSPLCQANRMASEFYMKALWKESPDAPVRRYVEHRGLEKSALTRFQIGYAPAGWDGFYQYAKAHLSGEVLERAGLVLSKAGGGYYDRFRNRLMFPVLNVKGECLGFGARVLDDSTPKYVNSPETEIYQKGRHLYGLWVARDAIRRENSAMIVEGYMDVISCFQHGVLHVVSSLGTALTVDQIRQLKKMTHHVTVVFDADSAGEMASLRGLDLLVEQGLNVRIASLPQGHDPDSYIRSCGADKFRQHALAEAKDIFDYKLGLLRKRYAGHAVRDRVGIAMDMLSTISRVPNLVMRAGLVQELARVSGLPEEALESEMNKNLSRNQAWAEKKSPPPRVGAISLSSPVMMAAERMLLGLLIVYPSCLRKARSLMGPEHFTSEKARDVARQVFHPGGGGSLGPAQVATRFREDPDVTAQLIHAVHEVESIENTDKAFQDCFYRVLDTRRREETLKLRERIRSAEDLGDRQELKRLLVELHSHQKGHSHP